jgi:hypothetical protein
MTELNDVARPAVEQLMQSDEDQLYVELGVRTHAIRQNPSLAGSFNPAVSYNAALMGPMDDIRAFGRSFFDRLGRDCYSLVCGEKAVDAEERNKLQKAFTLGKTEVAAGIAGLLVAHLAIAPAIAAVLAALVVKLFFRNAHAAMCEVWAGKIRITKKAKPKKQRGHKKT